MKPILLFVLLTVHDFALAGKGSPCDRMEYARLKDSTRQELTSEFCSAVAKDHLNEEIGRIEEDLLHKQIAMGSRDSKATQKNVEELGDARVSCIKASEDAANMLKKKFNAPRPSCKK